jgi:hypothetical protein
MTEKEKILKEADELIEKAKRGELAGDRDKKKEKTHWAPNSLADTIKTQEQADLFMKILKSL